MIKKVILLFEIILYLFFAISSFVILEYAIIYRVICVLSLIIIADFIASFVHELGHMIGGLFSKHKMLSFQFRNIKFSCLKKGNTISISKGKDQCIMIPDRKAPSFTFYQMGGILFNILVSLVAAYIGYYVVERGSLLFLFVCAFLTASICKIVSNGIPSYKNGYPLNDMAFEKILEKSKQTRNEYFQYLWALEQVANGGDISDITIPYSVRNNDYCDLFKKKIENLIESKVDL